MRAIRIGIGIVLAGAAQPAAAQSELPSETMVLGLAGFRFGMNAARNYTGKIAWTWSSGDAREAVSVSVIEGEAFCGVTYQDSEGTRSLQAAGLLEIDLGLPPDEDAPPADRNRKFYTIRVACPNAAYPPPQEARWSHSQESYKHVGGEVGEIDPRTRRVPVPRVLRGSWTAPTEDGSETTRMNWDLCVGCPPPPKP